MKRLLLLTALIATMAILFAASVASAQSTMRRSYDDLDIDIWTDKDDGSNYYEGDNIIIYFRASRDCYVTIYDLDTRGNVNLIFPAELGNNNFIQGDEIYMIPDAGDNFDFTLEGPPGNETIQIVAGIEPYEVPDWRGSMSVYDDSWGFKYDGDNDDFIQRVNRRYFPGDVYAYDNVSFYVAPRNYYQPEKSDCNGGDCGQVYIDYPNGTQVFINGVFYGYGPLYIPSIYLGRHRVTVYWGSSIVYNDWIYVNAWNPYFVYTRPLYVYEYCYTNWYRNRTWDSWYGGPSRYKYKDHDFYSYRKLDSRRGYSVVNNTHGRYDKSKVYADKSSRIEKFKSTYGYDKSTKTYTASKGGYSYDKTKGANSGKNNDFDAYNSAKKPTYGSGDGGGNTNTGDNGKRGSYGEVKKPVNSGGGKSAGEVKMPAGNNGGKSFGEPKKPISKGIGNSGSEFRRPATSGGNTGRGSVKEPASRRGGNYGGEVKRPASNGGGSKSFGNAKKPAIGGNNRSSGNSQPRATAPSSSGRKSSPSVSSSPGRSSGSSPGRSSGSSGGSGRSGGHSGGSKKR